MGSPVQNELTQFDLGHEINLLKMDAVDAFKLALDVSGKTWQEVAAEMKWQESHTKRVFSLDKYYPSYEELPKFCAAVGNLFILNWLQVQAMHSGLAKAPEDVDCASLVFRISKLFGETSDVGQEAQAAVADGKLEPRELRRLIRELNDVVDTALDMIGDLRALERSVTAQEG